MENKIIKAEYNETPFEIVKKSDILLDFSRLNKLVPELKETFVKAQLFRTRTEMEVSVLNDLKFPTPASKYWQAIREQNVHFQELVILSYEYRKNIVEIKQMEAKLSTLVDSFEKELLQIEIEKKTFAARNQERTAKDRIRELEQWSEIKQRESAEMSPEELSDAGNHQLISYTIRWMNETLQMGNSSSPSERQNLIGQLRSGVKLCQSTGVWDKAKEGFSQEQLKLIEQQAND